MALFKHPAPTAINVRLPKVYGNWQVRRQLPRDMCLTDIDIYLPLLEYCSETKYGAHYQINDKCTPV